MQSVADALAGILRTPADWLRGVALNVPMPAARGIFLCYFAVLLVWILFARKEDMIGDLGAGGKPVNLRPWAAAALLGQMVIYGVF